MSPDPSSPSDPVAAMRGLGFTEVEGRVYVWLAREGAATGYAVAKGIGKPVANVYKAIESLVEKGAVEVDEGGVEGGDAKTNRAVPVGEIIRAARGRFEALLPHAIAAVLRLLLVCRTGGSQLYPFVQRIRTYYCTSSLRRR